MEEDDIRAVGLNLNFSYDATDMEVQDAGEYFCWSYYQGLSTRNINIKACRHLIAFIHQGHYTLRSIKKGDGSLY